MEFVQDTSWQSLYKHACSYNHLIHIYKIWHISHISATCLGPKTFTKDTHTKISALCHRTCISLAHLFKIIDYCACTWVIIKWHICQYQFLHIIGMHKCVTIKCSYWNIPDFQTYRIRKFHFLNFAVHWIYIDIHWITVMCICEKYVMFL